jgi:hypothetical protein
MHTEHLILLEKSIDLMILRGLFEDIYPQHCKTASLILKLYQGIFNKINNPANIWEIKCPVWWGWYESILEITRNEKDKSRIVIEGKEYTTIYFQNGHLLTETSLSCYAFDEILDKETFLKNVLKLQ